MQPREKVGEERSAAVRSTSAAAPHRSSRPRGTKGEFRRFASRASYLPSKESDFRALFDSRNEESERERESYGPLCFLRILEFFIELRLKIDLLARMILDSKKIFFFLKRWAWTTEFRQFIDLFKLNEIKFIITILKLAKEVVFCEKL